MPRWTGKWAGGRTYVNKQGGTVWVLEKQVHGRLYTTRLAAGNENEALGELALFKRDPDAYIARAQPQAAGPAAKGESAASPVYMDPERVGRFLEHLKRQGRTERHRKNVRNYLAQWAEALFEKDLRTLRLQDLKQVLNGWYDDAKKAIVAKRHRIAAIKSFFSWLREEEAVLTTAEDPTLALKVPPARPEKVMRDKGYSMRDVERLYAAIQGWESKKYGWKGTGRVTDVQPVRDVLMLHAKCGMHGTEIDRLARGEGKVKVLQGQGAIAGTITFVHKSGRVHVQSVDAQALGAALRLQARGSAPADWWIRQVVKRAAKSIGLEPLRMGELRHSFVTWAAECGVEVKPLDGGVPLSRIAATIGHQSAVTTKKFYEGVKVPPMIQLPIRLEHPEDPVLLLDRQLRDGSRQ
ncbi:tyrosine-type recombinase/integrase [Pyxidicoccus fallax]|uniref:tyrosine-type recombinase/integrase n=1 Tax=Pyxidicoccus fallax TaxID=394095 RepID=UPI001FE70277|nr:site-specific integrase [Pyxidicoccus fallax]